MQFEKPRLWTHALLHLFAVSGPYNMKFIKNSKEEAQIYIQKRIFKHLKNLCLRYALR